MKTAPTPATKPGRHAIATGLSLIAGYHGATLNVRPCKSGNRDIGLALDITTPSGLSALIYLDKSFTDYVVHWFMTVDNPLRLAANFAPSVNQFHQQKATDLADDYPALCRVLIDRLERARDGTAFERSEP